MRQRKRPIWERERERERGLHERWAVESQQLFSLLKRGEENQILQGGYTKNVFFFFADWVWRSVICDDACLLQHIIYTANENNNFLIVEKL